MGFDRLHPAVQHHVVNSLGWPALRPLQERAIDPLLDGHDALLVAPTAGGKTEAVVLPLFSRMLTESWQPLSVLYVCPLRALLNNLEVRLAHYASLLGRTARLWHGDVGERERREIRNEPPDLLLTTPESLEVMLVSKAVESQRLFANLRAVVVDELHAFAGDDRGWHLLAVLERASRFAGRTTQRVGLSATIGNPQELLAWLSAGSGPRGTVVTVDGGSPADADVRVDHVGSLANAATVISRLYRGEKRLVFCDSRSRVEELSHALRGLDVPTFVSHGSLGVDERRQAEAAFAAGRDCVIVATSTLELGIDVGDLDRVLQVGAPRTVASFLQRLGRTGRRPGTRRNTLFLATDADELLMACALVHLWRQGFVEPVVPPALPLHVAAQQVVALTLQERGLAFDAWPSLLAGFVGTAGIKDRVQAVVDFMLGQGLLFEDGGLLTLGPAGQARFAGKRFLDLLSVFLTPQLFTVLWGRKEIGSVGDASLQMQQARPVLLLAGRPWAVQHVDWDRHEVFVEPTEADGRSLWPGGTAILGYEVCQGIRDVLLGCDLEGHLTARSTSELARQRTEWGWLDSDHTHLVRRRDRATWWTFAGLKANATLQEVLQAHGVSTVSRTNLSIDVDRDASGGDLRKALREGLSDPVVAEGPTALAAQAVSDLKFSFCLSPEQGMAVLRSRLRDPKAVARVAEAPISSV